MAPMTSYKGAGGEARGEGTQTLFYNSNTSVIITIVFLLHWLTKWLVKMQNLLAKT